MHTFWTSKTCLLDTYSPTPVRQPRDPNKTTPTPEPMTPLPNPDETEDIQRPCPAAYTTPHALSTGRLTPLMVLAWSLTRNKMVLATSSAVMDGAASDGLAWSAWTGLSLSDTSSPLFRGRPNSRKLGKPLLIPRLITPARNRLSNARIDRPRQHGIAPDAIIPEPPGHVFRRANLPYSISPPPRLTTSREREELTNPCLLAVYATPATAPLVPAVLATFTTHPSFLARINGSTARIILTGTVRFTASTRSQISSVTASALEKLSMTPATFTRTSIRFLSAVSTLPRKKERKRKHTQKHPHKP